jgi:hypothetical protein
MQYIVLFISKKIFFCLQNPAGSLFVRRKIFTMNKYTIGLVFLFFFSFCASNEQQKESALSPEVPAKFYAYKSLHLNVGECQEEGGACLEISWLLPYFEESWPYASLLNEALAKAVDYSWGSEGSPVYGLEEMLEQKKKDFLDLIKDQQAEGSWRWFDEVKAQVLREDSMYLSIVLSSASYYGGAHPNSYVRHFIFSKEKGTLLGAEDLFEDPASVAALVYAEVLSSYDLEPEIDLQEQGFFVSSLDFPLPENIGLTDSTFVFDYNPYEIGPYVMGFTSVEIPIANLQDFLKKD